MRGTLRMSAATLASALAIVASTPACAYADDGGTLVPAWLPYAGGLVSLVVALILLSEVLRLRKFAFGAAISAPMSYVIAAVVCLVASALAYWAANFLPSLSQGHAVLGANLLVTAAMALLVAYFTAVRLRLVRFAEDLTKSLDEDPDKDVAHA